jgi:hypothetical protein
MPSREYTNAIENPWSEVWAKKAAEQLKSQIDKDVVEAFTRGNWAEKAPDEDQEYLEAEDLLMEECAKGETMPWVDPVAVNNVIQHDWTIESIYSGVQMPAEQYAMTPTNELQEQLARQLATFLLEKGHIEFDVVNDPSTFHTKVRAKLMIGVKR